MTKLLLTKSKESVVDRTRHRNLFSLSPQFAILQSHFISFLVRNRKSELLVQNFSPLPHVRSYVSRLLNPQPRNSSTPQPQICNCISFQVQTASLQQVIKLRKERIQGIWRSKLVKDNQEIVYGLHIWMLINLFFLNKSSRKLTLDINPGHFF